MYQLVIVRTVTYGSESWGLREAERRCLNVFEMKYLGPMVGVTRRLIEECYDGLTTWKGWIRGAGQDRSRQLKWKVDRREGGLGLVG